MKLPTKLKPNFSRASNKYTKIAKFRSAHTIPDSILSSLSWQIWVDWLRDEGWGIKSAIVCKKVAKYIALKVKDDQAILERFCLGLHVRDARRFAEAAMASLKLVKKTERSRKYSAVWNALTKTVKNPKQFTYCICWYFVQDCLTNFSWDTLQFPETLSAALKWLDTNKLGLLPDKFPKIKLAPIRGNRSDIAEELDWLLHSLGKGNILDSLKQYVNIDKGEVLSNLYSRYFDLLGKQLINSKPVVSEIDQDLLSQIVEFETTNKTGALARLKISDPTAEFWASVLLDMGIKLDVAILGKTIYTQMQKTLKPSMEKKGKVSTYFKTLATNKVLYAYHRTNGVALQEIRKNKTMNAGDGAMYGRGVYFTYDLASQMNARMKMIYGSKIIKAKIKLPQFLVLDPSIAEKIYGPKYNLAAILKLLGMSNKSIQAHTNRKLTPQTTSSKDFYSSDLFLKLENTRKKEKLPFKWNIVFDGVVFTGRQDGKVIVVYDPSMIVNISEVKINGRATDKHSRINIRKVLANYLERRKTKPTFKYSQSIDVYELVAKKKMKLSDAIREVLGPIKDGSGPKPTAVADEVLQALRKR